VQLLVQPEDGIAPLLRQMARARKSIETTIFRCDLGDIEQALRAAVTRGVDVSALVAHTNRGGEKLLRKLELRLLEHGVTLARTGDDLVRYHGKILIVDRRILTVMLFNYTRIDTMRSRSFAVTTRNPRLLQEAVRLFEADRTRQDYCPALRDFVVSPENARASLTAFLQEAKSEISIYDPSVTDRSMLRILQSKARRGVAIRILGAAAGSAGWLSVRRLNGRRLHARVIVIDRRKAFLGSQSLRQLELDSRREVGLIVRHPKVVKHLASVFETDWVAAAVEPA